MALSKTSLRTKIETELQAQGIVITGEHAHASKFAIAIANAVVDEVTENAQVAVTAGSSKGSYRIN